jgi:hypothetical protein
MSRLVLKKDVARGIVAPGRSFPAPETCHHVQHSIRLPGAGKVAYWYAVTSPRAEFAPAHPHHTTPHDITDCDYSICSQIIIVVNFLNYV